MQASETADPPRPPDRDRAELVIRATRPSDCEAITALINLPGFRAGTLRLPYQSPEEVRKWLESRGPGSMGIVAVLQGTIVGTADLSPFSGRRSHAGAIGMGVHDDYRGRGIGTALLTELLDAADHWLGLKRIELTVFVDNAPAVALYERHGFRIEGTLAAYAFRNGAFADAYAMARLRS
jgi:putative acetyltransferase